MAGQTPQFAKGKVTAVDEHSYRVDVSVSGEQLDGVSYNPLAYVPRLRETVWAALIGEAVWVMGVASENP